MNENSKYQIVKGMVVPGHQIASGTAKDNPYPDGALKLQSPYFKAGGLDLSTFHLGTLNVTIAPHEFSVAEANYFFEKVEWTDKHPPENFSFIECAVSPLKTDDPSAASWVPGYIYYPHPETKLTHFQDKSVLEIITHKIDGITYVSDLWIRLDLKKIHLT